MHPTGASLRHRARRTNHDRCMFTRKKRLGRAKSNPGATISQVVEALVSQAHILPLRLENSTRAALEREQTATLDFIWRMRDQSNSTGL